MPYTVNFSFDTYRSTFVDLDNSEVKRARSSRDYLVEQLKALPNKDSTLPRLMSGTAHKPYGSFARSTKVRPLDDIDLLLFLDGTGVGNTTFLGANTYRLSVTDSASSFSRLTSENGYLSSIRVLNKFKTALATVPNYSKAEVKRNQVAVVLGLSSYPWNFDIVPAFSMQDSAGTVTHYLIPDGAGNWMRTDPRKDQELVTSVNKRHNGLLLPLIRLMKYWNTYARSKPKLESYYFEVMLLTGFQYTTAMQNIRQTIPAAFRHLSNAVLTTCSDPKGLGANLDANVDWDTKWKVSQAAKSMAQYADTALNDEAKNDDKSAISNWSKIFPNFPAYG